MKKKNVVMSLVLAVALICGSALSVFAGTIDGVQEDKVENVAVKFHNEVVSGKYKIVDAATLKSWVDSKSKMVIVDTMPAEASYNKNHVPGAINAVAPMTEKEFTSSMKSDMLKKVTAQLPNKVVTKTTWKKVSKKAYKKLSKKNRKVKTVKGKKYYYKKVVTKKTIKDKSFKVVVYCGHVGCPRSHYASAYLRSQGFTNVYRFGGGISAWKDAGYETEAVEVAAEPVVTEEPTPADPAPADETPADETPADDATVDPAA